MGTLKPWLLTAVWCAFVTFLSATRLPGQQLPKDKGNEKKPAKRLAPIPSQANIQAATRSNNKFHAPTEWAFQPLNELHLSTGTFTSPRAAGVAAPERFELLCYNGQSVGPTIRVRRGTTFRIRLKNDLGVTRLPLNEWACGSRGYGE
jgi:FtsP/CotA-like multicopper oxidase with cupredoxin domain